MLSASTSMPCSSIARMRSCPMIRVLGSTFSPISAIASGTAQCACTSTVFTRRPLTTTSRRRTVPPACACASRASRRPQPTKAMPAIAPAAFRTNSLRVGIAPPVSGFWLRRMLAWLANATARLEARILNAKPPYANFYRAAIGAIDKASQAREGRRFALLNTTEQREFVDLMRQGKLDGWQGPPGPFIYFVTRSDAVDVVYGTVEGYESLGIPYMPHIAPEKRW